MGVAAALIIAGGAVIAGGATAYSSAQAGSAAEAAGNKASAANMKIAGDQSRTSKRAAKGIQSATQQAYDLLAQSGAGYRNGAFQRTAIASNEAILPDAIRLARGVDNFNQGELERMLSRALPNYKSAVQSAQNNTLSMLRGELPADVAASVTRGAAERAKAGGFAGSESAGALNARDLGLTSLDLMREGSNSAQKWIQTARQSLMATPFDVSSMFITPQFVAGGESGTAGAEANLIYGSARDQAAVLTGGAKVAGDTARSAVDAALAGDAAQIKANQQAWAAGASAVQGAAGAGAGFYQKQAAPQAPVMGADDWRTSARGGTNVYY